MEVVTLYRHCFVSFIFVIVLFAFVVGLPEPVFSESFRVKNEVVSEKFTVCQCVSNTIVRFLERFPILQLTGVDLHKSVDQKRKSLRTCISDRNISREACISLCNDWAETERYRLRKFQDSKLLNREVRVLGVHDSIVSKKPEGTIHNIVLTIRRFDLYKMQDGKRQEKVSEYLVGVNADDKGKILFVDIKVLS